MHSSHTKVLLSIAAAAALAVPAGATAKQGADDPPGHVRHGSHAAGQHKAKHSSPTRDDRRGRGRGTDDGPNHT
jgi:hypothetical protein